MRGWLSIIPVPALLAILSLLVTSSCTMQPPLPQVQTALPTQAQPEVSDIEVQAAREATAIIERAKATALVLQAQSQATALVQQAEQESNATPEPVESVDLVATLPPDSGVVIKSTLQPGSPLANASDDDYVVVLLDITFGGEGGFIVVNFYATKKAVDDFWPGRLSVTDEATGTVYNEVAVMPIIGPLIGRPKEPGQPGYVMFVNTAPGLPPGSLVTVQLGEFRQEHVPVTQ